MTSIITTFFAKKALKSQNPHIKAYSIYYLSQTKNSKIASKVLIPLLSNKDSLVRNSAVYAVSQIIRRLHEKKRQELKKVLLETYRESSLLTKIGVLYLLQYYNKEEDVKKLLEDELKVAEHDLLFSIIQALPVSISKESLDVLLKISSENKDPLIVLAALDHWEESVSKMEKEERINYCTPRIHTLIKVYELWNKGDDILFEVLDHADSSKLPEGKLYPDVTMRILLAFLEKYEYSPNAYKNVYRLVIPEYFALT